MGKTQVRMRWPFTPTQWAKMLKTDTTKDWQEVEQLNLSYVARGNVK
jgi:hypothetical protein